ncbi:hypothetical protein COMA2_140105 [Candidatus Nitrospira nitrificans]|uniref:Uncharacterized protein n=1 Tax=Candidatus Nitrospira nitrificans TaxID=1742973 RepID=A0A0S4L835_9BACT|nr:hypothetical protein COMA2_140105 [Candidatus Nitrospira nitrificans]
MEDIFSSLYAEVAELADALDSGSSARKGVRVQIPASAPPQPVFALRVFIASTLLPMDRLYVGFASTREPCPVTFHPLE